MRAIERRAPVARPLLLVLPLAVLVVAGCDGERQAERGGDRSVEREGSASFVSGRVDALLGQLTRAATTRGFTSEGAVRRGFLVERGPEIVEIPLRSGSCYVVLAAASEAVRELDMTLYAGDGTELARDATPGRLAVIHHCPLQSGTGFVGVQAASGNGLFALRTLRGPNGLEVRSEDIVHAVEGEHAGP